MPVTIVPRTRWVLEPFVFSVWLATEPALVPGAEPVLMSNAAFVVPFDRVQ